jgi:hypothetical protein
MKIAVIGRFYNEAFALHISENLLAMGHDVCQLEIGIPSRIPMQQIMTLFT